MIVYLSYLGDITGIVALLACIVALVYAINDKETP